MSATRIQPAFGEPYVVSRDRNLVMLTRRSMAGNVQTITMHADTALAVADALVDTAEQLNRTTEQ